METLKLSERSTPVLGCLEAGERVGVRSQTEPHENKPVPRDGSAGQVGENQFPVNFTLILPFNRSFNLVLEMVGFCLTKNICPEDFILLAQVVAGDFSSWVKAHRVGGGQYAFPPSPSKGEPQQTLTNGSMSGINGTFPIP